MQAMAWSLIPSGVPNVWLFLALGSLGAMLFSMAKTGFGGGASMLAVPMMIYACGGDVRLANGIMLPVLIAADYLAVASWLGKWSWRAVAMLLPGTILGTAAGWGILRILAHLGGPGGTLLANAVLQLAVGLIALAFVALQAVRAVRRRELAFRPILWQGTCAGAAAGVTSTLAHSAAPIVTMYLLPQRMPKGQYVATTALYFWIINQLKLAPYFAEGLVNVGTLGACLALLPGIAAGAVLGVLLHRRVRQDHFTAVIYALLVLAGAGLIHKGLSSLL